MIKKAGWQRYSQFSVVLLSGFSSASIPLQNTYNGLPQKSVLKATAKIYGKSGYGKRHERYFYPYITKQPK